MPKKSPTTKRYVTIMNTFADRLRQAREAKGYKSAAKFANALGREEHTYRHYERGESEPDYETLERICHLLEITPNDLLPGAAERGANGREKPRFAKAG
jgi:transcriptional regulator with XRE-family HTH domain